MTTVSRDVEVLEYDYIGTPPPIILLAIRLYLTLASYFIVIGGKVPMKPSVRLGTH